MRGSNDPHRRLSADSRTCNIESEQLRRAVASFVHRRDWRDGDAVLYALDNAEELPVTPGPTRQQVDKVQKALRSPDLAQTAIGKERLPSLACFIS
jgi:hypothetical protein